MLDLLKVSSKSNPTFVAGALSSSLRVLDKVEIQAIGAGAVNISVKAIAISRGFMAPIGYDIVCVPSFFNVELQGEQRTAIKFIVSRLKLAKQQRII